MSTKNAKLGNPVPCRFEESTTDQISDLSARTGLDKSEIIRRAVQHMAPKFLNGEVPLVEVAEPETEEVRAV